MGIDFGEVNLTSRQILDRISEETIYEYYLNTKVQESKLIKCCFHNDSNPSMGFYRTSSNYLNYKCFGCGEQGNVFTLVGKLNNINYGQTLSLIQNTFKLSKNYGSIINSNSYISNSQTLDDETKIQESKLYNFNGESIEIPDYKIYERKTQILPTYRNFSKVDYDYWRRYYIPLELLVKYNIKACQRVYIVSKTGEYILFAEHHKDNPIYCYHIADSMKIYRPYSSKKGKWANNCSMYDIQGLEQLPNKGELLIITSSMKDVLVLNVMGYNAIALGGEGNNIPDKILDYLWACFDNIIVFYDNDKAGLEYGKKLSEQIGAGNIFIPLEYGEKDISDLVDSYDYDTGYKLMLELI